MATPDSNKLGYIGMGIMGKPMARNLMKAGFPVSVYNRTAAKARELAKEGAKVYATPRELAKNADVVFTNVTDTPDVEEVLFGAKGVVAGARRGTVVIDNSTISPDATREFAARLAKKGIEYLDAPVSGGDVGAIEGTLAIMVGGKKKVFDACLPYLAAMGKNITLTGPVGMGQLTKACNQIMCAINMMACCEALALAKTMGLDPDVMLSVVTKGAGGSWALENLGPKIAHGDMRPGFMVKLIQKDLKLVMEAAKGKDLPLPGTSLAHELFRAAQAMDAGDCGTQAMSLVTEKLGHFQFSRRKRTT